MPVIVYVPEPLPFGMEPIVSEYLERELRRISDALDAVPSVTLNILAVEPDKPEEGMIVYADGTNWDPGEGEGYYGYVNGAWVRFITPGTGEFNVNVAIRTITPVLSLHDIDGAGAASAGWVAFYDMNGVRQGYVGNGSSGNSDLFYNNDTADGHLQLLTSGTGYINVVNGGINFPATAVAHAGPNTLDDYEEGTWTPVWTPGSGTFTNITHDYYQTNSYVKIGRTCTLSLGFRTDAITLGTASGNATITGLPFGNSGEGALALAFAATYGGDVPGWLRIAANTIFPYYRVAVNGNPAALNITDLNLGADANDLRAGGIYVTT